MLCLMAGKALFGDLYRGSLHGGAAALATRRHPGEMVEDRIWCLGGCCWLKDVRGAELPTCPNSVHLSDKALSKSPCVLERGKGCG